MATKKATGAATSGDKNQMDTRDRGRRATSHSKMLVPIRGEKSLYSDAIRMARKAGPTKAAAALLRESHDSGDPRATYSLATWYIHGTPTAGIKVSPRKAIQLLRKAARKGVPDAVYDLAYSYEVGFGVRKAPSKAFDLYVQAAQKGCKLALKEVVRCIYYGVGAIKHRELALLIHDMSQ
jgi:TPR repeat protein